MLPRQPLIADVTYEAASETLTLRDGNGVEIASMRRAQIDELSIVRDATGRKFYVVFTGDDDTAIPSVLSEMG